MIAEISLAHELGLVGEPTIEKLIVGGWLLSPRIIHSQNYRYIVLVLPELYLSVEEIGMAARACELNRGWQTLATYLSQSGFGVIVSAAWSDNRVSPIENLHWRNYVYQTSACTRARAINHLVFGPEIVDVPPLAAHGKWMC